MEEHLFIIFRISNTFESIMIADKDISITSAQDSDSWEPVEFDTNTNESSKPANMSSDVLPGLSSTKKLEDLDTKITNLEETLAQQNNNVVTQMECLLNEFMSLKSSMDTKITQLEERLAQQNNNVDVKVERLVNEVMSLKDIVSSQQTKKDKARLDVSKLAGGPKHSATRRNHVHHFMD